MIYSRKLSVGLKNPWVSCTLYWRYQFFKMISTFHPKVNPSCQPAKWISTKKNQKLRASDLDPSWVVMSFLGLMCLYVVTICDDCWSSIISQDCLWSSSSISTTVSTFHTCGWTILPYQPWQGEATQEKEIKTPQFKQLTIKYKWFCWMSKSQPRCVHSLFISGATCFKSTCQQHEQVCCSIRPFTKRKQTEQQPTDFGCSKYL